MADGTITHYNLRQSFVAGDTMPERRGTIHFRKRAWAVGAVSLVMLALTAGLVSAQGSMPIMPAEHQPDAATTHEQMHQMMDAMHGEGASERMHQAMGEDGERMMDQCTAMMNMMNMMSMMGDGAMPGMMRSMMGR